MVVLVRICHELDHTAVTLEVDRDSPAFYSLNVQTEEGEVTFFGGIPQLRHLGLQIMSALDLLVPPVAALRQN